MSLLNLCAIAVLSYYTHTHPYARARPHTHTFLQISQGYYHGFVTGATKVIYSESGQLPSDAPQQITA